MLKDHISFQRIVAKLALDQGYISQENYDSIMKSLEKREEELNENQIDPELIHQVISKITVDKEKEQIV